VASAAVTLEYRFNVDPGWTPEGELFLAIEQPQTYTISLNGYQLPTDLECGWWVDRSLKRIPVPLTSLRPGSNIVTVHCASYHPDHPGFEIIYLLGRFGVQLPANDSPCLSTMPQTLRPGDICKQGFPFYSGNITFHFPLQVCFEPGQKVMVEIPDFAGSALQVLVDNQPVASLAWPPYSADITAYLQPQCEHRLSIQVIGHRRNSHGPLHLKDPHPRWTGPYQFRSGGDEWSDSYVLHPIGLQANPTIHILE
ncbi:MAG: hypothetical protein D6820_00825, partial [Lentisphaerae bacterium]